MSPNRGSGSWNSEYARPDWQPGYDQAPNGMHTDYQFSSREYQSQPPHFHAHGRARDGFYADDYNPRYSRYGYPDNYADPSWVPERRSPDYGEYHRGEDHYSHGPYKGGSFTDGWVESERDFRASSRSLDYSSPPSSRRSYDSPPPGSRTYHSRARDYDGYARPTDASRERDIPRGGYDNYRQQWSGSENDRRREDDRGDAFDDRNSRNTAYSNYRQPPRREDILPSLRGRSPPPPADRNNSTPEGRKFTPRFRPLPSRPSPGPPVLPRRTNPTTEYIEISQQPPTYLLDPALSRKLIVLDLNGSLVLRAAHTARLQPTRKGGGGHPYDNPTQPRPLRAVHPRPYLKTFTTYLLHDETKKWLDTMVWSSAQPHSVGDMVGKTFLERKDELTAVWARDTLGLTTEEYCKSSLPFINDSRVDFLFFSFSATQIRNP